MHLKYDAANMPIFTTMIFDRILTGTDAIGWALQGSLITNVYADAVENVRVAYSAGFDTEYRGIKCKRSSDGRYIADIFQKNAIDDLFESTGIADFYVLDSLNNQFYLPKSKWFGQFTPDTSLVNHFNEAGLPNIEGSFYAFGEGKGSFYTGRAVNNFGGGSYPQYAINFNSSRSSAIYGNSNTVQPPSSNKLLYYKVGNT